MFSDTRISAALDAMLPRIDAPPVPLSGILRRAAQPQTDPQRGRRYEGLAIAAAVALTIVALPAVAPGFVQSVEAQVAQILQWQPPPAAPAHVVSAMKSQTVTLATAASMVAFAIVPPAGLPSDVRRVNISTIPIAVYSKITHAWRAGSPAIAFNYRRADGRSFSLMADKIDPKAGPPSRYMFSDEGTAPDGREILVRHEHFAWRNGSQIMTVTDEGISAREIEAIRVAMRGTAVTRADTRAELNSGTEVKRYQLAPP
jgi:hypothetical protein